MKKPKALILRAPGTNCDEEAAHAWEVAGAEVETWHIGRAVEEPDGLARFQILTLPGGFSYGDDLGAGRIFAARLGRAFGDALREFRDRGGLILGICNGFQVLVKAGLLPGGETGKPATLARNASGRFEARWVRLTPRPGLTPFLKDSQPIELPVAHGEGRFLTPEGGSPPDAQIPLTYADITNPATLAYPANPNGSPSAIAGLCDPTGRVFGLMPHPERFIDPHHHPRWTRTGPKPEGDGLRIFRNAVAAVSA